MDKLSLSMSTTIPDLTQGGFKNTTSRLGVTPTQTSLSKMFLVIPICFRSPTPGLSKPNPRNFLLFICGPPSRYTLVLFFYKKTFGPSVRVSLWLERSLNKYLQVRRLDTPSLKTTNSLDLTP